VRRQRNPRRDCHQVIRTPTFSVNSTASAPANEAVVGRAVSAYSWLHPSHGKLPVGTGLLALDAPPHGSRNHRRLGSRSIGTMVGDRPAWMVPMTAKPCRS